MGSRGCNKRQWVAEVTVAEVAVAEQKATRVSRKLPRSVAGDCANCNVTVINVAY